MSKQHKIRWNKTDNEELAKVVRNFNAKITRLSKKDPQIKNVLPEKITVRQLKELINTRQDLKRELNTLRRFSKRGSEQIVVIPDNEYNLKTTKWQKTEMNRRAGIINARRKRRRIELEQIEMTSRGEKLGYTRGELGMGKAVEVMLKPLNAFTRSMSQKDLKWKWKVIMKEIQSDFFSKQDYAVRDNFIKALEQNFNPKDVKELIEDLKELDIKEFLKRFNEEGGNFELAYPPDEEQTEGYLNAIKTSYFPKR